MNWNSSVDIVTILRAVRARKHDLICGWRNRCFSSPESHFRWVSGTLFPAGKRPGRQATACYRLRWQDFLLYRSLNAIKPRHKNFLLELTLKIELYSTETTFDNNGIWRGVFWLKILPVFLEVIVIFFSLIVVLTVNGNCWVVLLLHSLLDMAVNLLTHVKLP